MRHNRENVDSNIHLVHQLSELEKELMMLIPRSRPVSPTEESVALVDRMWLEIGLAGFEVVKLLSQVNSGTWYSCNTVRR